MRSITPSRSHVPQELLKLQPTIQNPTYSVGATYPFQPYIIVVISDGSSTGEATIMDGGKKGSKSQAKAADERKDRRSATGISGEPKKGGFGGKFTWSGDKRFSDEVMVKGAIDAKDPNFED
ncbi:hypothetical protein KFK09_026177 [Dendrobium nobile]|uniref:Uncharacterized protein n=1 Tax=Dendrobium nobile TaxID=94219 RepID=A0A8T3AC58_DENNO|nr:hypothetical protein KFK09_026177 [Dendrobium nobile]